MADHEKPGSLLFTTILLCAFVTAIYLEDLDDTDPVRIGCRRKRLMSAVQHGIYLLFVYHSIQH